jgi:hypothetical protein
MNVTDTTPVRPSDPAPSDPVVPPAAEQLAVALEWLDHPQGFKLDAIEACIRALALARAELEADLASVKGVLHRVSRENSELRAMVSVLQGQWEREFEGDGR